jgi:Rieske Fe-S protein
MSETNSGSSRREFVTTLGAVAAASVVLPVLTNSERKAAAAGGEEWIATVKPDDIKDVPTLIKDKFKEGDKTFDVIVARQGNTIVALSNKCTHKQCKVVPGTGANKGVLVCPCHKGHFDYLGAPIKEPPTVPLLRHNIRLNADGVLEVNVAAVGPSGSYEVK